MPSRNRGKPKLKLRDLSRKWPTDEETAALVEHFASNSTPIVTAILGAALLEYELERMLRPRFRRQDEDTWKQMVRFFRDTLQSSDLDARIAAFESTSFLFDGNFAIKGANGEFIVHPDFVSIMEYMVAHEQDDRLRERAKGVLDTLDARLKKVVRKRKSGK